MNLDNSLNPNNNRRHGLISSLISSLFSTRGCDSQEPFVIAATTSKITNDQLTDLLEGAQSWSRLQVNEHEWIEFGVSNPSSTSVHVSSLSELEADESILTADVSIAINASCAEIFYHEGAQVPQYVACDTQSYALKPGLHPHFRGDVRLLSGAKTGGYSLIRDYSPEHGFSTRGAVIWIHPEPDIDFEAAD